MDRKKLSELGGGEKMGRDCKVDEENDSEERGSLRGDREVKEETGI